jgi:hypothetical protein
MWKGELGRLRQLVGREPADLRDVVCRDRISFGPRGPVQVQRVLATAVFSVAVHPDADEAFGLDVETRLLAELAPDRVERVLALVHEAAGEVPPVFVGRVGAAREQQPARLVAHEGGRRHARVRVDDVAAGRALDLRAGVLRLDGGCADGTTPPRVQAHVGQDRATHEQPEPTEHEQEQVPERLEDEDSMRGPGHENPPEISPDPASTDA